jgi:beta-glucosidase-like glycosyl hydrolase
MTIPRPISDLRPSELLGESFMPRVETERYVEEFRYREQIQGWVRTHRVGGFCIFGGTLGHVISMNRELNALALESHGVPLLFSGDFEFGLPMRLEGGTEFPDAMAIGRTNDASFAERVGVAVGREMAALGIGWNFAPVADVNSNAKNPIINTRAYGEDPARVSRFATQFVAGIQRVGVAACVKHFPGHGDTAVDSHRDMPTIHGDRRRFEGLELNPFRKAIKAGVKSVMLGHIAAPELARECGATIAEERLPASLSAPLITNLLRSELGFDGVIVTDALEMKGITNQYGDHEACALSYHAGTDVLLLPCDVDGSFDHLASRIASGGITQDRLTESAQRIFELKKFAVGPGDTPPLETTDAALLSTQIAAMSLDVVGTMNLPKRPNLVIIADAREIARRKAEEFKLKWLQHWAESELEILTPGELLSSTATPDVIVTFNRARGFIGEQLERTSFPSALSEFISRQPGRTTAILFGNPYLVDLFPSGTPMIRTFSEASSSIDAVIDRILKP